MEGHGRPVKFYTSNYPVLSTTNNTFITRYIEQQKKHYAPIDTRSIVIVYICGSIGS